VKFGGVEAIWFAVSSDTQILADIPAHSPGLADVVVRTPSGSVTGSNLFLFIGSPTVVAPTISSVTNSSAVLGGDVTSDGGRVLSGRGVVYALTSINDNPQLGGFGVYETSIPAATGPFEIYVPGLLPGVGYSLAAYAANEIGAAYSDVGYFTTLTSAIEAWRQQWYGTTEDAGSAADGADPYGTGVPNIPCILEKRANPCIAERSASWQTSPPVVRWLGREMLVFVSRLGDFASFVAASLRGVVGTRRLPQRILRAVYEQGALCLPVILIVGAFTGLVLGLQGYHVLNRFGSEGLLGALVSLSLIREMAPVLAALMLVGQAGSALAAELGIQRNSEQIVALETMGIGAHGYLVAPRLLAAVFVFPLQTALFAVVGLWGGSVSGSLLLGVESGIYWSGVERAVEPSDVRECLVKACTFGLLTTAICAYHGFNAHRCSSATGARAVSASTTRAVVHSSIVVLAADYVITSFLF